MAMKKNKDVPNTGLKLCHPSYTKLNSQIVPLQIGHRSTKICASHSRIIGLKLRFPMLFPRYVTLYKSVQCDQSNTIWSPFHVTCRVAKFAFHDYIIIQIYKSRDHPLCPQPLSPPLCPCSSASPATRPMYNKTNARSTTSCIAWKGSGYQQIAENAFSTDIRYISLGVFELLLVSWNANLATRQVTWNGN